ncbi:UDP-xylose and UDP-N-acetylglucosamine transporter [Copidosoma floridanum]|uniref:UDP-xylose and UDP-N-acetylglucosamine transporter n=1 Tax=Copidosoma floridanum TaxID=29053 RepID=UPI0006C99B29|nr:UDP-xylose and UDP-N-acetylglucosamine transporter [Copidosoma floridanum]XP_014212462.1 UDP-xylose and UDP-N-acetylglucosamine transporter [Copidosoma floridanum]
MPAVPLAICLVFLGCCSNLIFLELLMKEDPGGGNLVTFSQFVFIAIDGFIFTSKCGKVKSNIGIKSYMILVSMFFVSSVLNNYAFNFNIPMPLHMIFRAGSLIANMIMGIIILKKQYTFDKYLSVAMITVGIVLCTIISSREIKSTVPNSQQLEPSAAWNDFFWWIIGIVLLTVALFISARMGIFQETLYSRYGKNPREALYYTHLLPLPFFVFLSKNLWDHAIVAVNSPGITVPFVHITLPRMVAYLIGNVFTQYVCVSSVFVLTTECTSLTVTLILTLRKFLSLIFSIIYFKNPFTVYHWIGTLLVFIGTLIFTEVIPRAQKVLKVKFFETKENNDKIK